MAGIKAGTSLRIACEEVNGEAPAGRCKLCKYVLRFLGREFLTQPRDRRRQEESNRFCPPLSRRSSRLAHSQKCHYFSLQHASVFVPVVAQPLGYVGDIDYAYDSGNVFATSVARSNRVTNKALDKIPPGPKLDALTAEKVFGWRNIHKRDGALVGKRQGNARHLRRAKVPNYSGNPLHAYAIEDRMKQLGRL